MSYEVTIKERDAFVHATVTGTSSVDALRGFLDEVLAECKRLDHSRVLIEERLIGTLDIDEIYAVASESARNSLGEYHAVALVADEVGDAAYFAETVASNRGMPVRLFATVGQAEKWLLGLVEGHTEQQIFHKD